LQILLIVGMKLEIIITTMCKKSSQESVLAPGTVCVRPDNSLFWFGRPQLLLHMIQFILIQVTTLVWPIDLNKITEMIYHGTVLQIKI